jgi:glycosyltransferase involved in cell wall biosynthesis
LNPLVSIITASYNKAGPISDTILSVVQQTYNFWELLIVDDNSTDGTDKIVHDWARKDNRIKFFPNKENKGANFCRNFGIKQAAGEYIIFLDADDLLHENCIAHRVERMKLNPGIDFSVHTLLTFKKIIGDSKDKWLPETNTPLIDFLAHDLPWQTMQPIWRREFLTTIGGFDEAFTRLQDVELHTRALLHENVKFKLYNEAPDSYFRIDESRKNFKAYGFLERWVDSALRYCDKFVHVVPDKLSKYLLGTIYQTHLQLTLNARAKKITASEFEILEEKLLGHQLIKGLGPLKRQLFNLGRMYNLYFIRIPGTNRLIKKLLLV